MHSHQANSNMPVRGLFANMQVLTNIIMRGNGGFELDRPLAWHLYLTEFTQDIDNDARCQIWYHSLLVTI